MTANTAALLAKSIYATWTELKHVRAAARSGGGGSGGDGEDSGGGSSSSSSSGNTPCKLEAKPVSDIGSGSGEGGGDRQGEGWLTRDKRQLSRY